MDTLIEIVLLTGVIIFFVVVGAVIMNRKNRDKE